ncbi:MAG TPA: hypothetical protein VG028_13050 [Terriglobia bacterium]|nr:hypothetical protein [Terriglobia bacterium]
MMRYITKFRESYDLVIGRGFKTGIQSNRILLTAILGTILKLWLVTGQRLTAVYGPHDDLLFLSHARNLEAFKWLGSYNNLTLSKGMFYPLWIAVVQAVGLPLLMAQHILYVFACAVTARALRPRLQNPIVRLLLYLFLLFNPMSYDVETTTRLQRDSFYSSLTLLVVACSIALLLRLNRTLRVTAGWSVALGISLSGFWLTREEGPWIAPQLMIILGAALILLWLEKPPKWPKLVVVGGLPLLLLLLSSGVVATINKFKYGVFCTVEFKDSDFLGAYGALTRVKPVQWKPYYLLQKETRERIYTVSPAFAELKPFLEGPVGVAWTFNSCTGAGLCDDIGGGWLAWAFREAVAEAGYYKSAPSAMAYYRRLASEINAACEANRLDCLPPRSTMMPVWHHEYDRIFIHTLIRSAGYLSRLSGFNVQPGPSAIPISDFDLFSDMTRERISPPQTGHLRVAGWAFVQPPSRLSFAIIAKNGQQADFSITRSASPDVYDYFLARGQDIPSAHDARFQITTSCYPDCSLVIDGENGASKKIPLDRTVIGGVSPSLSYYFDSIMYSQDIPLYSTGPDRIKVKMLDKIAKSYQVLMPAITLLSLAAYLVCTVFVLRRRLAPQLWIIATSMLMAIGARLGLLSVIDVTLFHGINPRYLQPLYPLLILFQFVAIAACVGLVRMHLVSRTGGNKVHPR